MRISKKSLGLPTRMTTRKMTNTSSKVKSDTKNVVLAGKNKTNEKLRFPAGFTIFLASCWWRRWVL